MGMTNWIEGLRTRRAATRVALALGLAAAALGVLLAVAALAAPGDPDPTFDSDGTVTTDFAAGSDEAYAVAIQSDGKIVVAGYASGTSIDFGLARYNVDGSLDVTFGSSGIITTDFSGGTDYGYAVAIQSDGKIVVAGYASGGNADFALARYETDGSLDTTFGAGGITTTHFGTGNNYGRAVAIQSDGKIVVAGYARVGSYDEFALARYETDGSLDATFGTGGITTTDLAGRADQGYGVAIQADGKIIVAGEARDDVRGYFALARYETDGSLDTGFGTGGITATTFWGNESNGRAVAIQPDGKIVVAGDVMVSNSDFALARYETDGSLDTTFGTGGITTTHFGVDANHGNAVAIQAGGHIVVVGFANISGDYDLAVARYNADGSLDATFGNGGITTTHFGYGTEYGHAVAIQADHKIVVAARADGSSGPDFGVARYDAYLTTYLPLVLSNFP